MNFKQWLLLTESVSISQSLKKFKNNKDFEKTYNIAFKKISSLPPNVPEKLKRIYVNYFAFHAFNKKEKTVSPDIKNFIDSSMSTKINTFKDYLVANKDNNTLTSKLNNPEFSFEKLEVESILWHEELKVKKIKPAREADTFIDLSHLGSQWKGWRWVSLNKASCEQEANSMGHCGNAGSKIGDNILSLRDPQNIPHLTFIENRGVLGEMKGRGNDKPSPKYHLPIIELLKNNKILSLRGGGHAPENNFSLDDLSNKEALLKIKPSLDFNIYKKEFIDSLLKLPDNEKINEIEYILDEQFTLDEHQDFVYSKFESTEEFLSWMNKFTSSNIKRNLNFGFLDEMMDHVDVDISDFEIKEGIEYIDEVNFEKIKKLAKNENISLEEPKDILELADSYFKDDIMQHITDALRNAYEQSMLDEIFDDFKSSFESNQDKNYLLNKIYYSNDIRIVLNKKLLNDILTKFSSESNTENFQNLLEEIKYTYYPADVYPSLNKESFNEYLKSLI